MATDRKDTKVTRLDLRIPNDIYAQVEEIAKANNAPSHHISGNIILSPTLLKLISLGIRSLSGNYSELADISQPSDISSARIDTIAGELAEVKKSLSELSDKLSVYMSDTIPDIVPDTVPDSTPDIIPDTVPDTIPDTVPDTVPDIVPDSITDTVPDSKDGELEPAEIAPTPPPLPNSKTLAATPNRSPTVYPAWVNNSNQPFYNKVQRDPSLLQKVAEVMEQNTNNTEAAKSLVPLGLHKQDGSAYGRNDVSRIRSAVKHFLEDL